MRWRHFTPALGFGPGHGGHDDQLHLDAAPWRYVDL
jgi:hypothetical protein